MHPFNGLQILKRAFPAIFIVFCSRFQKNILTYSEFCPTLGHMQPALQVNVTVPNQPSSLARVCDKLRANNINISAITCTEIRENTTIHMIVDDPESAKIVLR